MPFGDYPTTTEKPIPYKLIGIVGGGVILAVLIIGGVLRFLSTSSNDAIVDVQTQTVEQMLRACDEQTDADACKYQLVRNAGTASGSSSVCDSLSGDEADACVWKYARETSEPERCDAVKNKEIKQNCFDSAYFALAKTNTDVSQCDKIEAAVLKYSCKSSFEPPLTSENCVSLGRSPQTCALVATTERAISLQDVDVCKSLADNEDISVCRSAVLVDDPDFDGLTSDTETTYQTDPRDPDTDHDGFKDGDEVQNGYNPNGPGKLETNL